MKRNLLSGLQLLSACSALGMTPMVLAAEPQTAPDPAASPQTPADPAHDPATTRALHPRITDRLKSYPQEPAAQTRTPEAVQQSEAQNPNRQEQQMGATSRAIDPSEVQKVFGKQASVVDIKSLDSQEIESLQQRLKTLGFYKGKVDGLAGAQTRAAIGRMVHSQFVMAQRLLQAGAMPSQLASALGVGPVDIQPTSGISEPGDPTPGASPIAPQQSLPVPPEPKTAPILPNATDTNPHGGDLHRDQNLLPRPVPRSSPALPPVDYPDAPTEHGAAPHG